MGDEIPPRLPISTSARWTGPDPPCRRRFPPWGNCDASPPIDLVEVEPAGRELSPMGDEIPPDFPSSSAWSSSWPSLRAGAGGAGRGGAWSPAVFRRARRRGERARREGPGLPSRRRDQPRPEPEPIHVSRKHHRDRSPGRTGRQEAPIEACPQAQDDTDQPGDRSQAGKARPSDTRRCRSSCRPISSGDWRSRPSRSGSTPARWSRDSSRKPRASGDGACVTWQSLTERQQLRYRPTDRTSEALTPISVRPPQDGSVASIFHPPRTTGAARVGGAGEGSPASMPDLKVGTRPGDPTYRLDLARPGRPRCRSLEMRRAPPVVTRRGRDPF